MRLNAIINSRRSDLPPVPMDTPIPRRLISPRARSTQRRQLPAAASILTEGQRIERHIAANFYPTPPEATRALLSVETFDDAIWEPACGQGHIAKVLLEAGYSVTATDLNDFGYGTFNVNFLGERIPLAKHIVTNPPYGSGLADDFINHALRLARYSGGKVAMLLNLASLAHERRTREWRKIPPARIYAIDSVVCWPDPNRKPPKHFLQHRYFWAVWEQGHSGPASFWWLSARDFSAEL